MTYYFAHIHVILSSIMDAIWMNTCNGKTTSTFLLSHQCLLVTTIWLQLFTYRIWNNILVLQSIISHLRHLIIDFLVPKDNISSNGSLSSFWASTDKRQWWGHASYSSLSFVVLFMLCRWRQAHASYSLLFFVVLFMSCRWQQTNLIHCHIPFLFMHSKDDDELSSSFFVDSIENDNEPTRLVVMFCVLLMGYRRWQVVKLLVVFSFCCMS